MVDEMVNEMICLTTYHVIGGYSSGGEITGEMVDDGRWLI